MSPELSLPRLYALRFFYLVEAAGPFDPAASRLTAR
jgi:hypothetical protein